jgi:hypothetical protein
MKKAGMPLTQELRITYTEIVPLRRLAYIHLADLIPGVEPYDVATVVELQPIAEGVRTTLSFDAMHSDEWTERAVMGWNGELGQVRRAGSGAEGGTSIVSNRTEPYGLGRSVGAVVAGCGLVESSPARVARPRIYAVIAPLEISERHSLRRITSPAPSHQGSPSA